MKLRKIISTALVLAMAVTLFVENQPELLCRRRVENAPALSADAYALVQKARRVFERRQKRWREQQHTKPKENFGAVLQRPQLCINVDVTCMQLQENFIMGLITKKIPSAAYYNALGRHTKS